MNDQPERRWQVGDIANGHRLDSDGVWRPLGTKGPGPRNKTKRSWYARPLGIIGILVGSLFLLGAIGAIADNGTPTERANGDTSTTEPESPAAEPTGPDPATSEAGGPAEPSPTAEPTSKPKPTPRTSLVSRVVDGDTIELGNGQTVRIVGIDTPERGQCGYEEASNSMASLVLGKRVRLSISDEDTDHYGRLLRYVNVGSMDAGLRQIKRGLAIARYDSRDGYGYHPREDVYIAADHKVPQHTCPKPKPTPQPAQQAQGGNCMAGYAPCLPIVADLGCGEIGHPVTVTGRDPYRLDADGDGVGCDS
jgi:endonuclease YncB( thermonuclease family)